MLISLRLLKKYISLKETPQEIMDALTMAGIEVEDTVDVGYMSGKIIVGEVKDVQKHPSADKLSVCKVSVDDKKPLLNIVCGAPNVAVGQKIPVALPSAVLGGGKKIEKTVIKGIESEGMLCSGKEIDYNDDESGILVLPNDWNLGEPVDFLIDIKVTPNRADCLSIIGVARDLAAVYKRKISPPVPRFHETMDRIESSVKLTIDDKNACPKYTCRLIRGVKIGPSPIWLQRAVESCGFRSVNNVVDITNFVMIELGHPLHAFDLDKITDHHIIVRMAKEDEDIVTLDNQKLKLYTEDLLITDPAKPIALAGVMGGLYSEIDNKTINVLLESAYFNPSVIRKTSKRLAKITDSSYRFERGTDIKNLTLALNRASQLIKEVAGGEIVKGILEVSGKIAKPQMINLNADNLNKVLGTKINVRQIADELLSLGFEVLRCDKNLLTISIPSFRVDIKREIDLIEEVARIYGYSKIPVSMPYIPSKSIRIEPEVRIINKIRNAFISAGFGEMINYSFINNKQIEEIHSEFNNSIKILNPISKDQEVMRTSLIPGILSVFKHNMNHNILDLKLFEIGKVYYWNEKKTESVEPQYLIAGISGKRFKSWNLPQEDNDFYDIKGFAENVLNILGIKNIEIKKMADDKNSVYHPYRSACFCIDGQEIIKFGEVHINLNEKYDLKKKVYILEAKIEDLLKYANSVKVYKELPRYPGIERDLAIILDENIPVGEILSAIKNAAGNELVRLDIFDIYYGEQVPKGKKSIAFSMFYQSKEKTLTEDMMNKIHDNIMKVLKDNFNAVLR